VCRSVGSRRSGVTLRVYAHAMRNEETDLSFAEFDDPKRPYTAPRKESESKEAANSLKEMVTRARSARSASQTQAESRPALIVGTWLRRSHGYEKEEMVTRARFAGQLRCLALAKLRFAANARPPASEAVPGIV
jgi:hypothetical protein